MERGERRRKRRSEGGGGEAEVKVRGETEKKKKRTNERVIYSQSFTRRNCFFLLEEKVGKKKGEKSTSDKEVIR